MRLGFVRSGVLCLGVVRQVELGARTPVRCAIKRLAAADNDCVRRATRCQSPATCGTYIVRAAPADGLGGLGGPCVCRYSACRGRDGERDCYILRWQACGCNIVLCRTRSWRASLVQHRVSTVQQPPASCSLGVAVIGLHAHASLFVDILGRPTALLFLASAQVIAICVCAFSPPGRISSTRPLAPPSLPFAALSVRPPTRPHTLARSIFFSLSPFVLFPPSIGRRRRLPSIRFPN